MGVMKNEVISSESWYSCRQPSWAGVPLHFWENLYDLDGGLQRMEQSLANTPIGGVGYSSKADKIQHAMDNTSKLMTFADYFTYDIDDLIDEKFYLSVHNDVLEYMATIDASKLTTNNTLGLQGAQTFRRQGYSGEIKTVLGSLNLGDFLGYNPTEASTGQVGRQQVEGFVNLFREKYDNFMAGNTVEDFKDLTAEEFAKMLIPGEFYVEREVSGWLKFLDMLSDILIVPAIVDACLGYDWITGDHLTQAEQDMRILGAAISAIVTVVTFGQAWAAAGTVKAFAKILLVSVISDIVATGAFAASDALGMPPALSAVIALIAGIGSGKIATDLLFKNGVANQAVLDDILGQFGDQIDDAARRHNMSTDDIARLLIKDPTKLSSAELNIIDDIFNNTRLIPGTPGVVTGGNSTQLGRNMFDEMGIPRSQGRSGYQAQHIIPAELSDHPVLQRIGMDMDNASNGIFLRVPDDGVSATSRHRGYHSVYNEFVGQQLDLLDPSRSVLELQQDVLSIQSKLRTLQESGLPLYPSQGATIDLWTRFFDNLP